MIRPLPRSAQFTRAAFILGAFTLHSGAAALDYSFYLDGQRAELRAAEQNGKVYVEVNKLGKYLGPVLGRVIDTNALVDAATTRVDLGPLNGVFSSLLNRAATQTKYDVIRLVEEPYVEVQAFARGEGAQLSYHPFDKTFVIGRDAAGLQRGEDARFSPFGSSRLRLDGARLNAGHLVLHFAVQGADETRAREWTFVGNGAVLQAQLAGAEGQLDVTLGLSGVPLPQELTVHEPGGSRLTYDLSSLR
ncbi:hypothetical protein [Deinococcus apachensis]|uniref:hypothetical protein n=1 Tax=Deinococcus apachensis TaxID=309886 RepID=UPI0003A1F6B8|nr:hypothetical protein [Deinococcus apachensis]